MLKKVFAITSLLVVAAVSAFAQQKKVVMNTTAGPIELILYDNTPLHSGNFEKLALEGFYDSLLFHRVIPEFMIQGGDPTSKNAAPGAALGSGGSGERIPAEFKPEHIHKRGALAAARDNNPTKASSNCQFYIVVGKKYTINELNMIEARTGAKMTEEQKKIYMEQGGTPFLDNNYTVYGEVLTGMDAVDKIVAEKRNAMDRPDNNQYILSTKVYQKNKKGVYKLVKVKKSKKAKKAKK